MNIERPHGILTISINYQIGNFGNIDSLMKREKYLEIIFQNERTFHIRKQMFLRANEKKTKYERISYYEIRRVLNRVNEFRNSESPLIIARTEKKIMDIIKILANENFNYKEQTRVDESHGETLLFQCENGLKYVITPNPILGDIVFKSDETHLFDICEEIASFADFEKAKEFARNFLNYFYLPDNELKSYQFQ